MLPLDELTDEAVGVLERGGYRKDDVRIALRLDLAADGGFGEVFLAVAARDTALLAVADGALTVYPGKSVRDVYVDHYTTASRLMLRVRRDAPARDEAGNRLEPEDGETVTTLSVGCCTNTVKRRLLAFVNVYERLLDGAEVAQDDPIFEQFNACCPKCGKRYEDQLRRICKNCADPRGTFVRLMHYLDDHKLSFAIVMFSLFAVTGLSLLQPFLGGKLLFDQVITAPSFDASGVQLTGKLHSVGWLCAVIALILGGQLLSQFFTALGHRRLDAMSLRITEKMKNSIFEAICRQSLSYFNKNPTGRLINRVGYDAGRIQNFFVNGVPHLIDNLIRFIGITVFLFLLNARLTLIVFLPLPIVVLIFRTMLPKLWRAYSLQGRRTSSMNAMLGDSLGGFRVVKSFARESDEIGRFSYYADRLYDSLLHTNMLSICIFPVVSLLIGLSSQAIWGFGGLEVMDKHMTYGELTTYIGFTGMIFGPLDFFTNFTNLLTDTINAADRMFETTDAIPEITNAPDAILPERFEGDVRFRDVCFHYQPNRPILKDVSFHIAPGDHVGLVGHTGSGKSTIANLITRMYDVVSGSVEIDGINVKQFDLDFLRKNVAIVSQEVYLFGGSIADNIRYAKPDATYDEVVAAAKAANAHDFILRLPEGYETLVGVGSRELSGGERQRISIARALLLQPKLLILDEATAAMDTETERQISEAVDRLIEGRTSISIAHRLSTLRGCHYIMAIENGRLAEIGTAKELLEKKGVYYKLYTLQQEQLQKVMSGQ